MLFRRRDELLYLDKLLILRERQRIAEGLLRFDVMREMELNWKTFSPFVLTMFIVTLMLDAGIRLLNAFLIEDGLQAVTSIVRAAFNGGMAVLFFRIFAWHKLLSFDPEEERYIDLARACAKLVTSRHDPN